MAFTDRLRAAPHPDLAAIRAHELAQCRAMGIAHITHGVAPSPLPSAHTPSCIVNLPDDGGKWGICTLGDTVYVVRWEQRGEHGDWVEHDSSCVPMAVAAHMGVVAQRGGA